MVGIFIISSFFILFVFYLIAYSVIDPDGLNEVFKRSGMYQ